MGNLKESEEEPGNFLVSDVKNFTLKKLQPK